MGESLHERMMKMHTGGGDQAELLSYDVALQSKEKLAEDTYAFMFNKPQDFHFTAGQHIRLTLLDPPETDNEGNSRFFSLASTPRESDLVIAMRMRDTAFKRVLGSMPVGQQVRIQMREHAHAGAFKLHEDPSRPAIFLVGGIGVIPAYSMVKDAIERTLPHRLVMFYSNRRPEDAPYLKDLQDLAQQHSNFKLVATMTEPAMSATTWSGITGRIDKAMLEKYVPDLKSPIYYISGLTELVNSMKALLSEENIKNDDIQAEEFGGFTINHGIGGLVGRFKPKVKPSFKHRNQ